MNLNRTKKIAISNRNLLTGTDIYNQQVKNQLLDRIRHIAANRLADALILREKDLTEDQYEDLAGAVLEICDWEHFPLILHHFADLAMDFEPVPPLHVSVSDFIALKQSSCRFGKGPFPALGVSTHTVEEARMAEEMGASYITASHIFPTQCKPGLEPRGLKYLREVCEAVSIPVYALGGVHPDRIPCCMDAGAAGVCMMSEYFGPELNL